MLKIIQATLAKFMADECLRMAAALAYYTLFSLPALLLFAVTIAGFFVSRDRVSQNVTRYFEQSLGESGAAQIQTMLEHAGEPGRGFLGSLLGMSILLFGATGAFVEMQAALNRIWKVQPDPPEKQWLSFITKRVLSIAMVLIVAMLLLTSLVLTWMLAIFREAVHEVTPDWLSAQVLSISNTLASLIIITLLFAAIFKYVPDVRLAWRDVVAGAFLTAVLYVLGKSLLNSYLYYADPLSVFGAAGSLALILLWIYYSALVVFLGAEFAQVTAAQHETKA